MRIKLKLALGLLFMFALVAALSIVSTWYIHKLSKGSKKIIKDNYLSLQYCHQLQQTIDHLHQNYLVHITASGNNTRGLTYQDDYKQQLKNFSDILLKVEANITEPGEKAATQQIRKTFDQYAFADTLPALSDAADRSVLISQRYKQYNQIKNSIARVSNINLKAMNTKSTYAGKTGDHAVLLVSILGALAFLVSFSFVVNFPGAIGNPIIEITKKIREVSKGNYDERIDIKTRDELGEMAAAFNTMAGKLKEFEKSTMAELLTEKGRIEAIVKNLSEGIILLDEHHIIKVINPAAASLLGSEPQNFLEKPADEVALKNDLFRELVKNLNGESHEKTSSLRITVNNEENFFIKDVFKVKRLSQEGNQKETVGYLISLRNVTEFKRLDLAKTNFISIISHELKTPISSINLSLKLMADERVGAINEEQKKLITSVREETARLSNITKELLDVSQVETGKIKLTLESVDPVKIVNYTTTALRVQLDDKNIHLIEHIPSVLPQVKADAEKTVWVMTNLLANAIRYTPQNGHIEVTVQVIQSSIQFSVKDTGPGIESKNLERIFQKFVQVDNMSAKVGVGLGLAISKDFITEQGGSLWVESELGIGSVFSFTLPVVV